MLQDSKRKSRVWTHLEDTNGHSTLHLHQWTMRPERIDASNNRQRLRLDIRRKHVLVEIEFVLRQIAERIVLDERKPY